MNRNQVKGAVKEAAGKVQKAFGDVQQAVKTPGRS
jgi:uncharacterized protein YjbJ (UPF0337 family)